jgi:hypothetical protein
MSHPLFSVSRLLRASLFPVYRPSASSVDCPSVSCSSSIPILICSANRGKSPSIKNLLLRVLCAFVVRTLRSSSAICQANRRKSSMSFCSSLFRGTNPHSPTAGCSRCPLPGGCFPPRYGYPPARRAFEPHLNGANQLKENPYVKSGFFRVIRVLSLSVACPFFVSRLFPCIVPLCVICAICGSLLRVLLFLNPLRPLCLHPVLCSSIVNRKSKIVNPLRLPDV